MGMQYADRCLKAIVTQDYSHCQDNMSLYQPGTSLKSGIHRLLLCKTTPTALSRQYKLTRSLNRPLIVFSKCEECA